MKSHQVIAEEGIRVFSGGREQRHIVLVEKIKDPVQPVIICRINSEGQLTQKDGERVEEPQELHSEKGRGPHTDQQVVFDPAPAG